jgi:outer membrane protein assembly factor BamB
MKFRLAIILVSVALTVSAADWPQFLGPHRDGAADPGETAITVPSGDPKILWRVPLGTGFAGPAVAQGKVIIFHRVGDEDRVQALDPASGKTLWTFSYPTNYVDGFGFDNGPRATPTVADGRVIVHGAEGLIHALDLKTGKKLWSRDTVADFQSGQGYFGRASAPVIGPDGAVIVAVGGQDAQGPAGLIALKAQDGTLAWQSLDDEASYSSPVVQSGKGDAKVYAWMRNHLAVCDATTGRVLFSTRHRSSMDASVNAATPIWCGADTFFTSACYGVGGTLWKVSVSADQAQTSSLKKVWSQEDALDCHYSTPVFYKDCLYGFHGRQEEGQTLRCIRAADGKVMWESPRVPGGALLRVKDTLAAVTEGGELWLVAATPEKFSQLSVSQILRAGHRSFPAFSNGVFYARDGSSLVAVDLGGKPSRQ